MLRPKIEPCGEPVGGRRWFVNRQRMTMVEINPRPGQKFLMGELDPNDVSQPTVHQVTLTRPFYICDREVWADLFEQFRNDPTCPAEERALPPAEKPKEWGRTNYDLRISPTGDCPMQWVGWDDSILFCNWLSRREGRQPCYERDGVRKAKVNGEGREYTIWRCHFDREGYRLPTEAEWEYACRAGTTTIYPFGDDETILPEYSNQSANVIKPAVPGGTLLPNAWGLFDMLGNVWEWCWDEYGEFTADAAIDPQGPSKPRGDPDHRVYRGGGVANIRGMGRSSSRGDAHCSEDLLQLGIPRSVRRAGRCHVKNYL